MSTTTRDNPWTPHDEGSHYPVTREWWTFETFFTTPKDKKTWNLMVIMAYNLEETHCFFQYALFDIINKTCVLRKDIDDDIEKFIHKKNKMDLIYEHNYAKGLFPDYQLHIEDKTQRFTTDMNLHAISYPHWITQNITDGELPIGLNFYRYGYIPNTDITGKMIYNDQIYELNGKAYIEHVWGDWSYQKPLYCIKNLRKTIRTYTNLGKWWLSQHKLVIPDSIGLTTENNIFGYDWAWGVFDNDWSVFYGNILFWLYKGPAFGVLTVTPDRNTFWEFCDITYTYNKVHYIPSYDIYFASDIELDARLDDKKIHLRFYLDTKCHDYIDPFDHQGFYKAFILAEMPGKIIGSYTDSSQKIKLRGDCKLMPLRQPSILGHNSITFDLLKPPKGFGVDIDLNSHYLKKHIKAEMHLLPKPRFQFRMKKLNTNDFTF